MEKLIRKERILLFAAISSGLVGAASIAGIIFFILKLLYVPMAICILLVAHGFYGCPLYSIRRADVKRARLVMMAMGEGERSLAAISEYAGVKSDFGAKLVMWLLKKGYVTDLAVLGDELVPTHSD